MVVSTVINPVITASSQTPDQNGVSSNNAAFGTNFTGFGGLLNNISGLTIANGMTAGYGDQDGHVDNPAAWPGTYGGNPKTSPNRIGLMRNLPGSTPDGNVYSLYFIFNPNQIAVAFAVNLNSAAPLYLYGSDSTTSIQNAATPGSYDLASLSNAASATVPNLTNSQTVSWSLIFDRTYDMLFDPNPDDSRGVLVDVAALYNIMGAFDSNAGVPVSTPIQCVFAQTSSGQLWGFTGYISSVNIMYGIFRHNMIPSRCEIDLQMTTTYVAAAAPGSGTPASAAASGAALTAAGSTSVNGTPLDFGQVITTS